MLDFEIGERRFASRAPVDQPVVAIDQPLAIEHHEDLGHRARKPLVEGKTLAAPITGCAELAQLMENLAAVGFAPLPDAIDELIAPEIVACDFFFREFALDDVLRRNSGVIGAGEPE